MPRHRNQGRARHHHRHQHRRHRVTGEVQLDVPAELHGFVVGGRGVVLKEIQTESGARVYVTLLHFALFRFLND